MGIFDIFKSRTPLSEMIDNALTRRDHILQNLHFWEMADCPVYAGDHWEIQFYIGVSDDVIENLTSQQANADIGFSYIMIGKDTPLVVFLLSVKAEVERRFASFLSVEGVGEKGSPFGNLNYFDILFSQPAFIFNFVGNTRYISLAGQKDALYKPEIFELKKKVDHALSHTSYPAYTWNREKTMQSYIDRGNPELPEYVRLGELMWKEYQKGLKL